MTPTEEQRRQAEERALAEYQSCLGKILRVNYLAGFENEDSVDVAMDHPILVRVVDTEQGSILHWNDPWLDPYWDVEVVTPTVRSAKLRSVWIDGPSHNAVTGERQWNGVEVCA